MFDLEIYYVKLKCTDINFIKAICGNTTPPFKMEIRFVYTEGNACEDTKIHELQNQIVACFNILLWDVEIISTVQSQNHFHSSQKN